MPGKCFELLDKLTTTLHSYLQLIDDYVRKILPSSIGVVAKGTMEAKALIDREGNLSTMNQKVLNHY